jgi:hypothetical protein
LPIWLSRESGTLSGASSELNALAAWLSNWEVGEAVMESTAEYWNPVWQALEGQCQSQLAQPKRVPKGRKREFADAERLVRRHVAGELILSFLPGAARSSGRGAP